MKKLFSILLVLVLVLAMSFVVSAEDNVLQGAGTEESPWLISDAQDFVTMADLITSDAEYADDYYQMTADVDFTGVTFTPIGKTNAFSGAFDGQFHEVSNLTITDSQTNNIGLFAYVNGGTVKNLGVLDSAITGYCDVGAIAGKALNAVFTNCYSNATVSGYKRVGGIVGTANSSQIYNSYSMATVTGTGAGTGGVVGSINSSTNTNNPASMDNVYSVATVTGTTWKGTVVGYDEGKDDISLLPMSNIYYYGDLAPSGYADRTATALTEAELTDGTLLGNLNNNIKDGYQQWVEGDDYYPEFTSSGPKALLDGEGTEASPYIVASAEDLVNMATMVDASTDYAGAYYEMTESIDLEGVEFNGIASVNPFTGTFDGTGHVLKNVSIDNGEVANTGVFHQTDGATIKNLGIESGMIQGGSSVGGIVGLANNTTILNCFNAATIYGFLDVGGLAGGIKYSYVYNSFNKGLIRIERRALGGLAGSASAYTEFKNCYNIGQVNSATYTGKLVGWSTDSITFENAYYDKDAAIKNQPVGSFQNFSGIVGLTYAELTSESFVDTLNANLEEGYMTWEYGEDGIARLSGFEDVAKIDIFEASVESVTIVDNKVQEILSADGAYKAVLFGSDNRNVIDLDGNVYEPLTTQKVLLILDIVDTESGEVVGRVDRNIEVTVAGKYSDSGENAVPSVIPGLREWYGLDGNFAVTADTKIAVADAEMTEMAERIKTYMKDMLGIELEVISGTGSAGDIVLKYTPARISDLREEGYTIEIDEQIVIESATETGMFYGAVSIMQILHQDEAHTYVPKGYVRDYPQYELRGGMIDAARKYFDLDYIEEIGKYMSWFKLNTLHLHISDKNGEFGPAFVVESKLHPELNSNNAGYVWSQDDYRTMQKNLKEFGVNVITEIDTPGHAGPFGYVDSTIMTGNDLNINDYYDECFALVTEVYDEFLDGDDPVFQNAIVHIGTDESGNTRENMRRWIGDLSQYVLAKDNVEKVVFWGNLSWYYGQTEIDPENVVAHIWDAPDYRVDEALNYGFEVINSASNMLYLCPHYGTAFGEGAFVNAYAEVDDIYDTWKGGSDFTTHNLDNPSSQTKGNYYTEHDLLRGNPKVLGALFCDWIGGGIGYDYDHIELMVPWIASVSEKCWYGDTDRFESGEEFANAFDKVDDYAAYANPRYRVDTESDIIASYDFESMTDGTVKDSENGYDATVVNGSVQAVNGSNVLVLDGTTSVKLPVSGVGYPYTVTFDVYLDGEQNASAILFKCKDCIFHLNYNGNGVSFETSKYVYSFSAQIPTDEWVKIKITSQSPTFVHAATNITVLSVNGTEYTPTNITNDLTHSKSSVLGTEEMFTGISGYLDNLIIYNSYNFDPILSSFTFEGEGTAENPYRISTAEDLTMFSTFVNAGYHKDAYFMLTADIDMSGVDYKPADEFNGTFDGMGYKISRLTISMDTSDTIGLVGYLNGGTIKNLGIVNSAFTGKNHVGAIVGKAMNSVVINCYTDATVTGTKSVGGLAGTFNSSQMYNCYSRATVSGTAAGVGGVIGSINSSTNTNNPASMDNVYSVATVTGTTWMGTVVGYDEGRDDISLLPMTNIYYYGDLAPSGYADRTATKLTEAALTDGTLLDTLNSVLKDGYAEWSEGVDGYPTLGIKVVYGDATGDGAVNLKDALRLLRYISDDTVAVNLSAADMDGDTEITVQDVLLLLRVIVNGGSTEADRISVNKNVNFVGMSIWWYDGRVLAESGVGGGVIARGYQTLLKEKFDFNATQNYCYSGYSLGGTTESDAKSIANTASTWTGAAGDVWTLDTITNDFKRNIPIGTIDDYTNNTGITTYYGALRVFKDKVTELSGESATVICANALRRNNSGYTSTSANTNGHTLADYSAALVEVAKLNNWHFIDQFNDSGITDDMLATVTLDGLHLNNDGYKIAVKPWIEMFEELAK